jgi:quercetin dioxygenase-like cupin family protein
MFMSEIVWKSSEDSPLQKVSDGIFVRPLWQGAKSAQAMVVEIAPGAQWEGIDSHEDNSEEVFVVSGVFNDGVRDYSAGTFIHHPIGSSHIPQSIMGCKLFIFYPAKT